MASAAEHIGETHLKPAQNPGERAPELSALASELEVEAGSTALSALDIKQELLAVGLSIDDASQIAAQSAEEAFQASVDDYRDVVSLESKLDATRAAFELERKPSRAMRFVLPLMSLGLLAIVGLVAVGLVGLVITTIEGQTLWIPSWITLARGLIAGGVELSLLVLYSLLSGRRDKRSAASPPAQAVNSLESQLTAKRENIVTALIQEWIRPALRSAINDAQAPSWSTELTLSSGDGLFQPPGPQTEIATDAREAIEGRLALWSGGSIGLAGPRGVGKSTLIETVCRVEDTDSGRRLGIPVSAPVQYEPRDFILHLFAMVCEKVLSAYELPTASLAVLLSQPTAVRKSNRQGVVPLLERVYVEPFRRLLFGRPELTPDYGPTGVGSTASELLQEIRYQQTFTAGWSGSLSLPIGIQMDRGQSYARASKSLPEVVGEFRAFLEQLGAQHQVVIGIDEVDKIAAEEDARRFLDDIKGIFAARNCFFIVSVSEDALSAFERRGLPLRDAVDSALDDVIAMNYLDWDASRELIRRRVVGLPEPFNVLCHVLGGGLPRDILRVGRSLAEAHARASTPTLSDVTRELLGRELSRKRTAAQIAIRASLEQSATSREVLTAVADDIRVEDVAVACGRVANAQADGVRSNDHTITLEFLGYAYFVATVKEFFVDANARNELRTAVETSTGPSSIETLVQGRQAFSLDLHGAWDLISTFREAWAMMPVPFPNRMGASSQSAAMRA